jgi:hypothetical protein
LLFCGHPVHLVNPVKSGIRSYPVRLKSGRLSRSDFGSPVRSSQGQSNQCSRGIAYGRRKQPV